MGAPPARARADYDYLIKLLLIDDSGVGKSCLLLRFSDGSFTTSFITTIGFVFLETPVVQIYYRGAMGILVVYDVTDESSFNSNVPVLLILLLAYIRNWIRNIEQHASDNVNMVLVGNKADMDESKRVMFSSDWTFSFFNAIDHFFGYYWNNVIQQSAKTNLNVEEVFFSIASDIKQRLTESDNKAETLEQPVLKLLKSGIAADSNENEKEYTVVAFGLSSNWRPQPDPQIARIGHHHALIIRDLLTASTSISATARQCKSPSLPFGASGHRGQNPNWSLTDCRRLASHQPSLCSLGVSNKNPIEFVVQNRPVTDRRFWPNSSRSALLLEPVIARIVLQPC
ncbi:Ras-related protein RABE1d [Hibiscus syriacus]|uniref:Ras-related protein RABE1d n=1 Tax=Hibiscus syriacus TaxID=106335 RepID=A0A6A2XUV9_HIBSY|nr:Ras-related protein RABE1d [Hibiscus syriacus]